MKIVSPKYDYVVKELFRDKIVLKHFIGDVLGIPQEQIRTVRLKNTFLRKWYRRQKMGVLDVLVDLNDDTKIDIELQIKVYEHWDKRLLFYLARLFTEDLQTGQNYSRLRKCVGISILNFNLSDREEYHSTYYLMDKNGNKLSDMLEVHILELKKKLEGQSDIENWIRFFNIETEEDIKMIRTKNPGILQAIGLLQRMSMNSRLRRIYEAYQMQLRDDLSWEEQVRKNAITEGRAQGIAEGKAQGIAEGKAQGIAEGKAEAILDLLDMKGGIPHNLRQKILAERNEDKLREWLRIASVSQSADEFCRSLR